MGLGSYFKAGSAAKKSAAKKHAAPQQIPMSEKLTAPSSLAPSQCPTPRSTSSRYFDDMRHEIICTHLYQSQCVKMWISDCSGEMEGVVVKKSQHQYVTSPPELIQSPFALAIAALNVPAALTVNSRIIRTFLQWNPNTPDIPLPNGLRIQCLSTMEDLPRARKHQCAALIVAEALLVVWDDEPSNLIKRAAFLENEFVTQFGETGPEINEKKSPVITVDSYDEETGVMLPHTRATHLQNSVLVGLTLLLITIMVGAGFRQVAIEVAVDNSYIRIAFLLLTPVQIFFTLFFAQVIIGCIAQCIGPIVQMKQNSRYYSGVKSPRVTRDLPHITIQCPVYKEGLEAVIVPTVRSIKDAISTYELQGGTANIFINDDGLQLLSEEERSARLEFYEDNNIGWVARPKHGEDGFLRRGKFKKASNMNYALMVSCQVEDKLAAINRPSNWTQADEADAYGRALVEVLETHQGRAWADGNVRLGEYILLIDSDTRVPADCLLDACSEMEQSPDVGIMQFSSGVMNVTDSFFENGITFFTNLIYTAIRYTVSNGDVAPFVGHNAILRWSAIQQVSYMDEDGYEKFWSESHVSEDFDMSLRLQVNGYIIRMAAWAGDGFKEGVSLTVYDELARWEKYAYGCNELLFHPIRFWIVRGPFTPLFRSFLFSNIRFTSKVTIISYIGTYYAIGAAWILTSVNYLAIGWFNGYLDKYYIDSWRVWFSIIIVFNGLGNLSLAIMRYRTGEKPFFTSLCENLKWIVMFAIFLGGLSLHVSQALLAHMFEVNMTWGATSKEAEQSNFFVEVPRVINRFKFSILFAVVGILAMIVLATASFVPYDWRITDFTAILPMATVCASHLLLPIALNPALMTFSF